jgi:hypothetical protein
VRGQRNATSRWGSRRPHRMLSHQLQVQPGEIHRICTEFAALRLWQRDHAFVCEIAFLAPCFAVGKRRKEFLHAWDGADVHGLHVKIQRPRDRVAAIGDSFKGRADPIHRVALQLVSVLIHELNPKMPNAAGFASSFCTIRLSFSRLRRKRRLRERSDRSP